MALPLMAVPRTATRAGAWGLAAWLALAAVAPGPAPAAAEEATGGPASPAAEAPAPSPAPEADLALARRVEDGLVEALERVRRASVSVLQRRRAAGLPRGVPAPLCVGSVGSGVVVEHRGTWVVTNLHVIQGADALEVVTFDGRAHRVTLRGAVERHDLAVLAFDRVPAGLEAVRIPGSEAPAAERGDLVLATGNPFFLANDGICVATLGVVSGPARWLRGDLLHGATIQHDAPVNPGNSGGPLWSLDGRLVGINETIATHSRTLGMGPCSTGASFSIAADQVRRSLAEVLDGGAERSTTWRGCRFVTARDERGRAAGAEVGDAEGDAGGPARCLGLARGDVVFAVTSLDGARARRLTVETAGALERALADGAGRRVRVDSRRGSLTRSWTGTVPVR